MPDFSQYVGLEFEDKGRGPKFDCLGLVRQFVHDQFSIELPSYIGDYDSCMDGDEIAALVKRERETTWQPVIQPAFGDVVILRIAGLPWHCGVMLDQYRFLHIMKGINSGIERLNSAVWLRRIDGIYRHTHLCAMAHT